MKWRSSSASPCIILSPPGTKTLAAALLIGEATAATEGTTTITTMEASTTNSHTNNSHSEGILINGSVLTAVGAEEGGQIAGDFLSPGTKANLCIATTFLNFCE